MPFQQSSVELRSRIFYPSVVIRNLPIHFGIIGVFCFPAMHLLISWLFRYRRFFCSDIDLSECSTLISAISSHLPCFGVYTNSKLSHRAFVFSDLKLSKELRVHACSDCPSPDYLLFIFILRCYFFQENRSISLCFSLGSSHHTRSLQWFAGKINIL